MTAIDLKIIQTSTFVNCKKNLFLLPLCFLLLITACSQSDDQREFEQQAFSTPEGFTETKSNGEIVEGRADPDDWRVSPFYRGLIDVFPPYPNPVLTNERVTFEVSVAGIDAVDGFRVYAFYRGSSLFPLFPEFQRPLPPGLLSISLNPLDIAEIRENPQGLYRIIVLDAEGNVITYGDIRVD